MKHLFFSLILLNTIHLQAANPDPCDGPAGCPIIEHIKDEGDKMLEMFLPVAIGVMLVASIGGAATSGLDGKDSQFKVDRNEFIAGIQLMPVESNFEINSLTLTSFETLEVPETSTLQVNLLEFKYKFN